MSLTPSQILDEFEKKYDYWFQHRLTPEYTAYLKAYLKKLDLYPKKIEDREGHDCKNYSEGDYDDLKVDLEYQFGPDQSSFSVMKEMECALKGINQNDLESPKVISGDSRFGYVLDTKYRGVPLVVKGEKSASSVILHELVVGYYGLNRLRKDLPNFCYTYGLMEGGKLTIFEDKIAHWSQEKDNDFVLMEKIDNSVSLFDFLRGCTPKGFLSAYLQLIYSLSHAKQTIDFTHYDLHTKNVLIRRIPYQRNFSLRYVDPEGSTSYVNTSFIATMIDFGMSHFYDAEREIHIGFPGYEEYFVDPDGSWIINDLHKVLAYSMEISYSLGRKEVCALMDKIYHYFNKDVNSQYLAFFNAHHRKKPFRIEVNDDQPDHTVYYDTFNNFPRTAETENLSISGLLKHIKSELRDELDGLLTDQPTSDVLNPGS